MKCMKCITDYQDYNVEGLSNEFVLVCMVTCTMLILIV